MPEVTNGLTQHEQEDSVPMMIGGNVAIIFGVWDLSENRFPFEIEDVACHPSFISHSGIRRITGTVVSHSSGIPNGALSIKEYSDSFLPTPDEESSSSSSKNSSSSSVSSSSEQKSDSKSENQSDSKSNSKSNSDENQESDSFSSSSSIGVSDSCSSSSEFLPFECKKYKNELSIKNPQNVPDFPQTILVSISDISPEDEAFSDSRFDSDSNSTKEKCTILENRTCQGELKYSLAKYDIGRDGSIFLKELEYTCDVLDVFGDGEQTLQLQINFLAGGDYSVTGLATKIFCEQNSYDFPEGQNYNTADFSDSLSYSEDKIECGPDEFLICDNGGINFFFTYQPEEISETPKKAGVVIKFISVPKEESDSSLSTIICSSNSSSGNDSNSGGGNNGGSNSGGGNDSGNGEGGNQGGNESSKSDSKSESEEKPYKPPVRFQHKPASIMFVINHPKTDERGNRYPFGGLATIKLSVTSKEGFIYVPPEKKLIKNYWKPVTKEFIVKVIVYDHEVPWTTAPRCVHAVVGKYFVHELDIKQRIPSKQHNMCFTETHGTDYRTDESPTLCADNGPYACDMRTTDGTHLGLYETSPGRNCDPILQLTQLLATLWSWLFNASADDTCMYFDDNSPVEVSGVSKFPGVYCFEFRASVVAVQGPWHNRWCPFEEAYDHPIPIIVDVKENEFYNDDPVIANLTNEKIFPALRVSGIPWDCSSYDPNGGYQKTVFPGYEIWENDPDKPSHYAEYEITKSKKGCYVGALSSKQAGKQLPIKIRHEDDKWQMCAIMPQEDETVENAIGTLITGGQISLEEVPFLEVDDNAPEGGYATEPPTEWRTKWINDERNEEWGDAEWMHDDKEITVKMVRGDYYTRKAEKELLGFYDVQGRLNGAFYYRQCGYKVDESQSISDSDDTISDGYWLWSKTKKQQELDEEGNSVTKKYRKWFLGKELNGDEPKYSTDWVVEENDKASFPPKSNFKDDSGKSIKFKLAEHDNYIASAYTTPRKLGENNVDICATAQAFNKDMEPVDVAYALLSPNQAEDWTKHTKSKGVAQYVYDVKGQKAIGKLSRYFPKHWDLLPMPFVNGEDYGEYNAYATLMNSLSYSSRWRTKIISGTAECDDTTKKPYKKYVENDEDITEGSEKIEARGIWEHNMSDIDYCKAIDREWMRKNYPSEDGEDYQECNRVDWLGKYTPDEGGSASVEYDHSYSEERNVGDKLMSSVTKTYSDPKGLGPTKGSAMVTLTPCSGRELDDGKHTMRFHGEYKANGSAGSASVEVTEKSKYWNEEQQKYIEDTQTYEEGVGVSCGGSYEIRGINPEVQSEIGEIRCGISTESETTTYYGVNSWSHQYVLYYMIDLNRARAIEITESGSCVINYSKQKSRSRGLLFGKHNYYPEVDELSGTKTIRHSWHYKKWIYDPYDVPWPGHPGFKVLEIETETQDDVRTQTIITSEEKPSEVEARYEKPEKQGGNTLYFYSSESTVDTEREEIRSLEGGIS